MQPSAGHIGTIIIAALFALLLLASLLPVSQHAPDAAAQPLIFTQFIDRLAHREPEVAPTVASSAPIARAHEQIARPSRRGVHEEIGTARPVQEMREETQPMTTGAGFFEMRLTDLMIIALLVFIGWQLRQIWNKVKPFDRAMFDPLRQREASDEIKKLDRAASAMEALAQTMIVSAKPVAPNAGRKRGVKRTVIEETVEDSDKEI